MHRTIKKSLLKTIKLLKSLLVIHYNQLYSIYYCFNDYLFTVPEI